MVLNEPISTQTYNKDKVASQKLKLGKPVNEAYCKGCGSSIETQEHCLSVCKRNMPAI